MHATLPPVFLVNIKENGNCIRQIGVPAWSGEVTCSAYQEGNKRGLHIQPVTDAPSVVLFTGTTTAPAELE